MVWVQSPCAHPGQDGQRVGCCYVHWVNHLGASGDSGWQNWQGGLDTLQQVKGTPTVTVNLTEPGRGISKTVIISFIPH